MQHPVLSYKQARHYATPALMSYVNRQSPRHPKCRDKCARGAAGYLKAVFKESGAPPNAPSRESCAMVVRDCVSRHRKLPEVLVVDGGGEFDSVHFTTLLGG
jgi:hypothetical protein